MPREYAWVRVRPLTAEQKAETTAACERLIAETLVPRYLPEVRPRPDEAYPIRIFGRWRGSRYSFIVRFRSEAPNRIEDEYDDPFARLDHVEERSDAVVFDVMWLRHTGRWWPLHREVPLDEALRHVAAGQHLAPPIWPELTPGAARTHATLRR